MDTFNIIGIGEILWDMLPEGKELGGAPANFAYHAQNLGGNSSIISAIGSDPLGNEIKDMLENRNQKALLTHSELPTGVVEVEIKDGIPSYVIIEQVAWDDIHIDEAALGALKDAHAICFGSLAQRSPASKRAIENALATVPPEALKVFDINLRQHFYSESLIEESLEKANVFKINEEELTVISKFFNLPTNPLNACQLLLEQYNLLLVALTHGGENSLLVSPNEHSLLPTPKVQVVDTVGAGDSFTAAVVMGLLHQKPLKTIHQNAVDYSAQVCRFKGATPKIDPKAFIS